MIFLIYTLLLVRTSNLFSNKISILRKSVREICTVSGWEGSGWRKRALDRTRRKERLISGWMGERYGSTQLKLRWNYFPVNRGHVLRSDTSKEAAARYQPCFSRFRPLCTPTCRHSFAFLLYNWHCSVLLRRKQLFRDKCIVAFDRNRKAEEKLERNIGRGF